MTVIRHNPAGVFPPYRAYAHATEVRGDARLLFVSGLNGCEADGKTLPESFDAQAELIWKHLGTILASAGMEYRRRGERSDAGEAPRNPSGVAHRRVLPAARPKLEARDGGGCGSMLVDTVSVGRFSPGEDGGPSMAELVTHPTGLRALRDALHVRRSAVRASARCETACAERLPRIWRCLSRALREFRAECGFSTFNSPKLRHRVSPPCWVVAIAPGL